MPIKDAGANHIDMAIPYGRTFADWVAENVPQQQYTDSLGGMCFSAPKSEKLSQAALDMFGIKACEYGCQMDGGSVRAGCLPSPEEQALQAVKYLEFSLNLM